MVTLSKIAAIVALGSVLAAGTAYALLTPGGENARMHNHFAVPFTQRFAAEDDRNCGVSGAALNAALTFANHWDGLWNRVNERPSRTAWASCRSGWASGYLNARETVPNVQALNLSTLPLMR